MGASESKPEPAAEPDPKFMTNPEVADALPLHALSDEQIVAISRQLAHHEAHAGPASPSTAAYARALAARAAPPPGYKVPRVRFGKTELQMPILTCGGMRVQQSAIPDHLLPRFPTLGLSIGYHEMSDIDPTVQANLIAIIRRSIAHGIVHFETARFYGTSEMQYADALATMIESGEVKREDLIIQTKIMPSKTNEDFEKTFEASWKYLKRLQYIDLLAFHGVSTTTFRKYITGGDGDAAPGNIVVADKLVAEGRVRHLGFSTHGSAREIRLLIETRKFAFVNLHCHFFGDYHAAGTSATLGDDAALGGNLDNLKLAQSPEYDMGCFLISPYDKGGALYKPSKKVVELVGAEISPIAFGALYAWKLNPYPLHTISLGAARPEDFDESVTAARAFEDPALVEAAAAARARLDGALAELHGADWAANWWRDIPDCFEEASGGVAIGHMLWLHNVVSTYGMWDFARERYSALESTRKAWDFKKSHAENITAATAGFMWNVNPGMSHDPAAQDKPETALPEAALARIPAERRSVILAKLAEVHGWLTAARGEPDDAEREAMGWVVAYDLRAWQEFPGKGFGDLGGALKQQFVGGVLGGPSPKDKSEASVLRSKLASSQTPKNDKQGEGFFAEPVTDKDPAAAEN